jgi:small subunit ribosomal protein S15
LVNAFCFVKELNTLYMPSKIAKAIRPDIIKSNQIHTTDTGSPEVQVAVLSDEIKRLTLHLQENPKDHATRRSLLRKVGARKKLLNYLLGEDRSRYLKVCKKNGIRPSAIIGINPTK